FYEARMYGFLRLLNLHLRFFPSSLRYKRGWRRAFSLFPPGMVQKEADTAYGNIWDALAQAWGFRKGQSRSRRTDSNGRLVKLDGKQAVTAWPASLVRQIGFSPDLNRRALIERALEVYRKRHCLPGDWTERFWDTDVLTCPSGIKNRAYWKCPVPVPSFGDATLASFAPMRMWWPDSCYPDAAAKSYRVIDLTRDPELGDWKHGPDPKNSGVYRRLEEIGEGRQLENITRAVVAEYEKHRRFKLSRRRRLSAVAKELIALARSVGPKQWCLIKVSEHCWINLLAAQKLGLSL